MFKKSLLVVAISASAVSISVQAAPSMEETWQLIQQQQVEIEALKSQLEKTENKLEETDVKVTATADAIDRGVGMNTNMAKLAEWAEKTTVGGYGEMHYNNLDNQRDGGDDKNEIDLHRFVLFFGHQFTDNVRFYSELEVEHSVSGDGKSGEVEVEQAYIEWDYAENHSAKGGVFLVPAGIINETHEPDTFYGVERNSVEKNIIPATWWEGGAALSGQIAPGFRYDLAAHSGLYLNDGKSKIRDGRQKVSKAKADDFAYTARVKYTGVQGLELAATVQYQEDLLQGETQSSGASEVDAVLIEAHAVYQTGPFALRALYANWSLDNDINLTKDGADEQEGWYVEPSFKVTEKLGVFARFSEWDNQAGDSDDSEIQQMDVGVNYWVADTVVLKADYQDQRAPAGKDEYDGVNLGIGWSF